MAGRTPFTLGIPAVDAEAREDTWERTAPAQEAALTALARLLTPGTG